MSNFQSIRASCLLSRFSCLSTSLSITFESPGCSLQLRLWSLLSSFWRSERIILWIIRCLCGSYGRFRTVLVIVFCKWINLFQISFELRRFLRNLGGNNEYLFLGNTRDKQIDFLGYNFCLSRNNFLIKLDVVDISPRG